ncbi:MAG: bifunctional diguanylate cyclase/phosphodiesterase [Acidaminococcaceae bacterium]|nr:bifunctional diguanylate cyclase/phosphodiesterase [Acidaminococcaceae bacterium]
MNFCLLSILAFCVFVAILYLKSSEHQRMLYSQKYVRDKVSGTLGFDKFKEQADELLQHRKEPWALIHLDIEPYHDIVDIYGCETADNVLRILGTELNRRVVKGYLTTRQGGDKFFCLVPFVDEETHNNWFDGLADMVESEVKRICNISIKLRGDLYVFHFEDSLEDALVKTIAQLNKKVFRKCSRSFFMINDLETATGYYALAGEVCSGLENKEFAVYFQPQYNIYTNEIIGAEALLRWEHPKRGIILPEVLIPILADSNQLSKFENFVFEEICHFLALRLALGLQVFPISCNFSFEHFKDENFINSLKETADKHNVPHKLLVVELAERLLADDVNFAGMQVDELKNQGFKIAVDNFGAGYLSLRTLPDNTVYILKIDKRMLAACDNDKDIKIIKGMAAIAKELDITMICEGVETEAQVAIMKSVSCNIAQGFYYCQPLRRPQFEKLSNLSKIEIINAERRSINGYGRTVKLPSYRDLGDLFPQMYDFAIELNLKDGRYSRMAFNPTGNVFIPYTGAYKTDHKHIVQELLYPEDIEKFAATVDFDVLCANYNNAPEHSGCECRFVGAGGVAQWYKIRVYYWFGRSRILITVRNVNDAHEYLDDEYEKNDLQVSRTL